MIWVDTIYHLESLHLLDADIIARRDQSIQSISTSFTSWLNASTSALLNNSLIPNTPGLDSFGQITNSGDASYAFDLLCHSHVISLGAPVAEEARRVFNAFIHNRRLGDMRSSDFLYCGIHLRAHFPADEETRQTVESFIRDIRTRYQNNDFVREADHFHGLVLRLLTAHYGNSLHDYILEKLWVSNRAAQEAKEVQEQQELIDEFAGLIRQSIHVQVSKPLRITGTRARGEIYRVRFGLKTEATDEYGGHVSAPRDSLGLIIKKGPPDVMRRATERYRELPDRLKTLFASHADTLPGYDATYSYLIMQDLADMRPLSEIMLDLDRPVMHRDEQQKIASIATSVAKVMQSLHSYQRYPPTIDHQFSVIYLTTMSNCLNRLCQPQAFPELKQWLEGSLEANDRTYKSINWYLKQLSHFEERLNPLALSYSHGDCHSRNIMLNQECTEAKFVDIDTLTNTEDYIIDYGLLIEDLAVYQSLPYYDDPGRLEWDEIQTSKPNNPHDTLDNWVKYPAFPQRSDGIVLFQNQLLSHLQDYATDINDSNWKERLWLAIARGLLLLSNRQLKSYAVEPHRRSSNLKLVQVTYVEAVRLLHELIDSLDKKKKIPLPDLPFPGEHRPILSSTDERGTVTAIIEVLSQEFGDVLEHDPNSKMPYFVDYFLRKDHRLFARVFTKHKSSSLYLRLPLSEIGEMKNLIQPSGDDDLPVCLPITSNTTLNDLVSIVRQALQFARK